MKHIWSQTKLIKRLDGLNSNELNRREVCYEFNDIETMVKSKFKDIKKHAEEIAHEIEVRSGYLRKAEQYKRLEFNLSFALDDIESTAKDVQTAKSSANKDSVTVKGKAPNTLYIEKRN